MSLPEIVSREEWTRARLALLEHEKAVTKARDDRPPSAAACREEPKGRGTSLAPRADQPGAGAVSEGS